MRLKDFGIKRAQFPNEKVRDEWLKVFDNESNALEWYNVSFSLDAARVWYDVGFSPDRALEWYDVGFPPDEARMWYDVGLLSDEAMMWYDANFTSLEAKQWRDAGFLLAEAKIQKKAGYIEPNAASQAKRENSDLQDVCNGQINHKKGVFNMSVSETIAEKGKNVEGNVGKAGEFLQIFDALLKEMDLTTQRLCGFVMYLMSVTDKFKSLENTPQREYKEGCFVECLESRLKHLEIDIKVLKSVADTLDGFYK